MAVNYNDKRLVEVKSEEEKTLNKSNTMYNSMIADSQKYYDSQIDASKEWAETQTKLQQEQTDFAIEKLEQQKEQANKDYLKEQSGSYVDWQKESNRYGANAESMAASGFVSSGYGESAQVSMWNTYQNRVASARESYNKIVLEYDNAMKDARMQNNSKLAEIAYKAQEEQLALALQGFQYKNQLIETQANKQLEIKNMYHQQYQDVLQQINTENALAEQIRQFNESLAEEKRQFNASLSASKSYSSSGGSSGSYSSSKSSGSSSSSSGTPAGPEPYAVKNNKAYAVNTAYYKGDLNPDAKNGTFSNGYQPNNVNGKKLSKTGDTIELQTQTLSGQKQTVVQNVWKTSDGTRYYWEGRQNRYIEL